MIKNKHDIVGTETVATLAIHSLKNLSLQVLKEAENEKQLLELFNKLDFFIKVNGLENELSLTLETTEYPIESWQLQGED